MWPSQPRPLVLAHRGFHLRERENTLPAFEAAQEAGADGIELDVRSTRDGALVLHHDARLADRRILGAVPRARAPAWMPTLEEVLGWAQGQPSLLLDVELKESGLAAETLRLVRRFGEQSRCVATSFEPEALSAMRDADPLVSRGLIASRPTPRICEVVFGLDAQLLVVPEPRASLAIVESARQRNIEVWTWGEGTAARVGRLAGLGVDGFIVNRPDRIAAAVDRLREASIPAPAARRQRGLRRGRRGN